jgi:PKD repeat protein
VNAQAQGEDRVRNWQKAGIAILAIIVAFAGWELVHPRAPSDPPITGVSYDQGRTAMLEALLSSIRAAGPSEPTAPFDQPLAVASALTGTMSLTPSATNVRRNVIFSATAAGGTGTYWYNWSFGDGASDRSPNTFHAYSAPRTYSVILWVNDSAGASVKRLGNVTVNPLPVASALASPTATDVGSVVGFSGAVAGGTAPLAYAWNFDDESSSTSLRPNHTYGRAGKFTVAFTATDAVGATTSASLAITVNPQLVFTPTASTNRPTVADDVSFNVELAGGTPPFSYDWAFGDGGRDTAQNATHRFRAPGAYNVHVTVTDAVGASPTHTLTIAVAALPESTLSTSSAIAISSLTLIASVAATALAMTIIQRRRQSRLGRWRPK